MQPATINHYPIRSKLYPVFYSYTYTPGVSLGRAEGVGDAPNPPSPAVGPASPLAPGGNV